MAAQLALPLILLITLLPFLSIIQAQLPSPTAPAPTPAGAGPPNITAVLEKGGQYNTFIRFLQETAAGEQINNQANNSHDGMTVFAPTDSAFQNLPAGTLNQLSNQQQVQLVQYHILPKFYTFVNLQTVSNPVRTQASGQGGKQFVMFFTGEANNQNQVNISTGLVNTTVSNALSQTFPLAVYSVDKVLLPADLFPNASAPAPSPPAPSPRVGPGAGERPAEVPSSSSSPSGSERMVVGLLSLASGLWLISINLLS